MKKLFLLFFVIINLVFNIVFAQNKIVSEIDKLKTQQEYFNDKLDTQYKYFHTELDNLRNYYNRELEIRTDDYNSRLNIYLSFVIGGFALIGFLITFLGKRSISNWIKTYSENKVSEIIEQKLLSLNIEVAIKQKSDDLVDKLLSEIESKGKIRLTELDDLKQVYISALSSLNEEDVSKPSIMGDQIKSLEKLDAHEKALSNFKKEKDYSLNDWYFKGLREYEKSNNLKALNYWKKALEIDPNSYMILTDLGIVYNRLRQHQLALEYFDKAIKIEPKRNEPHIGKGNVYFDENNNEKAIEEYSIAVELEPNYWGSYFNRGLALGNIGKLEKALLDYDKAIELNPTYSEIYFRKGKLYEGEKEFNNAIVQYNKAIEYDPINSMYYERRASTFYKAKNYKSALQDFMRTLELEIENTNASLNICELSLILDNVEDAQKQINKLLDNPLYGDQQILTYVFKLITEIILESDYSLTQQKINEIMEKSRKVGWDFCDLLDWLNKKELNETYKEIIISIITKIKK